METCKGWDVECLHQSHGNTDIVDNLGFDVGRFTILLGNLKLVSSHLCRRVALLPVEEDDTTDQMCCAIDVCKSAFFAQ